MVSFISRTLISGEGGDCGFPLFLHNFWTFPPDPASGSLPFRAAWNNPAWSLYGLRMMPPTFPLARVDAILLLRGLLALRALHELGLE